jgi:hypothetical protein
LSTRGAPTKVSDIPTGKYPEDSNLTSMEAMQWVLFCLSIGDDRRYRVEAGSNTSTVTLRVIRGNEKGSLESETVKYGPEYQGIRTRERLRWHGPAAYIKDRPVLSSERAPHKNKTVTIKR